MTGGRLVVYLEGKRNEYLYLVGVTEENGLFGRSIHILESILKKQNGRA